MSVAQALGLAVSPLRFVAWNYVLLLLAAMMTTHPKFLELPVQYGNWNQNERLRSKQTKYSKACFCPLHHGNLRRSWPGRCLRVSSTGNPGSLRNLRRQLGVLQ